MNSTFIYQDTKLPGFLQFPEFLLQVPISQTAKMLYLVLYDRSRLSMRNEWTDEFGRIYVIFPIVELAKRIGKSESTIKAGMKELCEAGLLMKRSGGFSKPNYLYVKYALEGQFFERMRKQSVEQFENTSYNIQEAVSRTGCFSAPNKVMNHSNPSSSNRVMDRCPRGRYENIYLSNFELAELEAEFPAMINRYLEELSEYMASTGKTYVNYVAAIRRWAANDRKKVSENRFEDYKHDEEESF